MLNSAVVFPRKKLAYRQQTNLFLSHTATKLVSLLDIIWSELYLLFYDFVYSFVFSSLFLLFSSSATLLPQEQSQQPHELIVWSDTLQQEQSPQQDCAVWSVELLSSCWLTLGSSRYWMVLHLLQQEQSPQQPILPFFLRTTAPMIDATTMATATTAIIISMVFIIHLPLGDLCSKGVVPLLHYYMKELWNSYRL